MCPSIMSLGCSIRVKDLIRLLVKCQVATRTWNSISMWMDMQVLDFEKIDDVSIG